MMRHESRMRVAMRQSGVIVGYQRFHPNVEALVGL